MALSDSVILTGIILAGTWFLFFRGNLMQRFVGDMIIIITGIATYTFMSTDFPWGILIAVIGLVDGLFGIQRLITE